MLAFNTTCYSFGFINPKSFTEASVHSRRRLTLFLALSILTALLPGVLAQGLTVLPIRREKPFSDHANFGFYHWFEKSKSKANSKFTMSSLPSTYKAWRIANAGEPMVLKDLPLKLPGAGEVLVKVLACGICYTDYSISSGEFGPFKDRVPGHETVGEVVAVGESVTRFKGGERVGGAWHGGMFLIVRPAILPYSIIIDIVQVMIVPAALASVDSSNTVRTRRSMV